MSGKQILVDRRLIVPAALRVPYTHVVYAKTLLEIFTRFDLTEHSFQPPFVLQTQWQAFYCQNQSIKNLHNLILYLFFQACSIDILFPCIHLINLSLFSDQRNSLSTQASYESIGPPPERSDRPLSMTTDDDVSWGSSEFDSYDSTEDEERRNSINSRKNGSRSDPARSPQIIAATVEYKVKGQQQPQVQGE